MYVDFKEIKKQLSFQQVLEYYGISHLKKHGLNLSGSCPLHQGDNRTAFHINLSRKVYNCFTRCGGGNILDFIAQKEHITIYQAALKAIEIMKGRPVEFSLNQQRLNEYLLKRGVRRSIACHFGLSIAESGKWRGRLIIPLRDKEQNTICYVSRSIDETEPKYMFEAGFKKSDYLYNYHNLIPTEKSPLFIVEGFFDVIHLYQLGYQAVGLMGCSVSNIQLELLSALSVELYLLLDGDAAGQRAMVKISQKLNENRIEHKNIYLPQGIQPEHLTENQLQELLNKKEIKIQ